MPSATIKDTSYAIPTGALFVSPAGNDANSGTQAAPLRTIQRAVALAPAGGTIVLRQGEYRELVRLNGKGVTIQPYPLEKAWIKGSNIVTDWVVDGSAWRKDNWTFIFAPATPELEDPAYPMAKYPDMVFVDGRQLTQVASRAQVTAGTFFVDTANRRLYIGDNPAGRVVEAAARQNLLEAYNSPNTVLRGLGFAHAASSASSASGAVIVNGGSTNATVENNTFSWNAGAGLEIGPSNNVMVRGNTFTYNSWLGITGWGGARGTVIQNNYIAYNNQEHFSVYWAAGGVKIVSSYAMTWSDNVVENNLGSGLWCDISCSDAKIVRNLVRNNNLYGIHYEISANAIIASNVVANHPNAAAIYVSESSNVQVYNNTLVNNLRSVSVNDSARVNTNGAEVALGITWETRNVTIKNNILSHSNTSNQHVLGVYHEQSLVAAGQMVSAIERNAYYRKASSSPGATERWGQQGVDSAYYWSVDLFRQATGYEQRALSYDNMTTNPYLMNETGDYRLRSGSPAASAGDPLPTDVAAAIGVPAGVAVDIGALNWPGRS
ncbi:MAG: right-handed parallel beta-helix repeat-containing protein [Dehalococcoidia bacterium]